MSMAMSTGEKGDMSMGERGDMSMALVRMEKSEDCESGGETDLSEHENVYDVFDLRQERTVFFLLALIPKRPVTKRPTWNCPSQIL